MLLPIILGFTVCLLTATVTHLIFKANYEEIKEKFTSQRLR
jgi:hypothetical protein